MGSENPELKQDFFDFNNLSVGSKVVVRSAPNARDDCLAMVTRVNRDSIDVLGLYGGRSARLQPFADCWHEDDPRCRQRPHVFKNPLRGVFRLADEEIARVGTLERLADLEQLVKLLVDRIEQLEERN